MKQLLMIVCLVFAMGYAGIAMADVEATALAVSNTDMPTPTWVDEEMDPGKMDSVSPEGETDPNLAEALQEAIKRLEDLRSANGGKMLLVFLMLAAFGNLFISGIKRLVRWRAGKISKRWKKWLPRIALGLGVVVGFLSYYGTDGNLIAAFLYGAGPPMAVFVQEIFGFIKSDAK